MIRFIIKQNRIFRFIFLKNDFLKVRRLFLLFSRRYFLYQTLVSSTFIEWDKSTHIQQNDPHQQHNSDQKHPTIKLKLPWWQPHDEVSIRFIIGHLFQVVSQFSVKRVIIESYHQQKWYDLLLTGIRSGDGFRRPLMLSVRLLVGVRVRDDQPHVQTWVKTQKTSTTFGFVPTKYFLLLIRDEVFHQLKWHQFTTHFDTIFMPENIRKRRANGQMMPNVHFENPITGKQNWLMINHWLMIKDGQKIMENCWVIID